jgi:hypothetical protein
MVGQVPVAIKNRCKQQVLDHADLILIAPGANPRTTLIAFVKLIEGQRLCDLTVVSIVQDDIKGLNPIASFPDAVDNIIAINLLQEELTLMGQPYSDADLIIQHSNKMPNTDDFRALKMEFIDCDVSQFATSRPTLTHMHPNPLFLRNRKTWDEYCHKVQRYTASEPPNPPQSALSARMDAPFTIPSAPSALAASSSPDLEATIRRILAETKPAGPQRREYSQQEKDAFNQGRRSAKDTIYQPPQGQAQQARYQSQLQRRAEPRIPPQQQRAPLQHQQSKPYQDQPRNQFRQPPYERQLPPPPFSNADRRPQHGNKRAFAAMESYNEDQDPEGDRSAVYGAHQEYDEDGNYQQSLYAMSASMEPYHDYEDEDDQANETYAS